MIKVPGIIICSRKDSSRIPGKPFRKIGGKSIINHLIDNLKKGSIGLCIAIPKEDLDDYITEIGNHVGRGVNYYVGYADDPLARMHNAAKTWELDPIIRVCHDKIFVEAHLIQKALDKFNELKVDYLYSSWLVEGAGFEIISRKYLIKAFDKFCNHSVEHISYAIKALNPKMHDFKEFDTTYRGTSDMRFLIDYEADLDFIKIIYQQCGENPNLRKAISVAHKNKEFTSINKLPLVTVYTCAYNAEKFIKNCMLSVIGQSIFDKCEFIIIDDCSEDKTLQNILYFNQITNVIIKRNDINVGLSSSSNIALGMARGKYIIRLDADDVFIFPDAIESMIRLLLNTRNQPDALYPNYICEKSSSIVQGKVNHHIGGTLFKTSSIQNVKFTEKLRGYEGLDFFERAKKFIKIAYFNLKPIFYYSFTKESMSNSNEEDRKKIKEKLDKGITGSKLV